MALARYEELERLIKGLPLASPGLLASRSTTLGELGLVKATMLMRYRDQPIALVKSHNSDLPKYPGKSFLTLHNNRYSAGSTRAGHDVAVEVVQLGEAVPSKERFALHQLANEADFARTCSLVIARVRQAGAQHVVVQRWKPDAPEAPDYSEEHLPVEAYSAAAAYLSPTWLQDQGFSAHMDAHKSFHGDVPLPAFVAELCEPQHLKPILPYLDVYLVQVDTLEARVRQELTLPFTV